MKNFKSLTNQEALARFENWTIRNLNQSFTIEKFKATCHALAEQRSAQALNDIAYYIQYAYIIETDYLDIINTVVTDLRNFNIPTYQMLTSQYENKYATRAAEDEQNTERLKDTAMISAILSDHLLKPLMESRDHGYIDTVEKIADAAIKIFELQSQKPGDLDWDEYLTINSITSWDEWVVLQGEQILNVTFIRQEAY